MISAFGTLPPGVRVLVTTRPVDFRRGADGLAATVHIALPSSHATLPWRAWYPHAFCQATSYRQFIVFA